MLGNPLGGAVYFRAISAFASYDTAQLPCKFTTFFRADHNSTDFFRHIRPSPFLSQPANAKKNLFTLKNTELETTAKQALLDGA